MDKNTLYISINIYYYVYMINVNQSAAVKTTENRTNCDLETYQGN